ncbi:hypothetical protein SLS56_010606 [Neofusicoccum ribis]|uniref:Major facilitator superfamily (MFS) profile domain-containing protein n=1 Tax=Neofusicoccum ribis TaxID=45134 RepID=A0ABR3SEL3_9PEZI
MHAHKTAQSNRQAIAATTPLDNKTGHWWHDRGLLKLNLLLFIPLMSEYVQGYDASLINNVQQLKTWQNEFHHPQGSLLGILSASYWIGNILGVFLITKFSDGWGRRTAMFLGSSICIVGTALVTGAVNAGMFIAGRLLLGIGGVLVGAIGPVLMAELAYPSHRATATAMSNTQYSTGAIVAAWITFGSFRMNSTWSWRIPSVFQALPSIFQAVGILFLPESPRWLVSKGRNEKALEVLAHYHANGDREDPVVQYEYNEICSTIEMEIAAKQTKWSELWRTPGNRWRSFIMIWCGICKQWSGNGLVSYYLHSMLNSAGIKTELQQTLITATSQMFSLALFVEKGQSWSGSESASYASVAFIYLYSGVHNLGWTGAMMVYVVEVLPYTLRAKGIALFWLLTGAAGAFNTYVNPLGLEAFDWKFYWFYIAWIAVEFVVVYIFFIETKGPSLEAVAMLFDGKDATVGEVNKVVEAVKETKGGVEHVDVVEESR